MGIFAVIITMVTIPSLYFVAVLASYFSKAVRSWKDEDAGFFQAWKIVSGFCVAAIFTLVFVLYPFGPDNEALTDTTRKEMGMIYFTILLEQQRHGALAPSTNSEAVTKILLKSPLVSQMASVNWSGQIIDGWGTPIRIDLADPMHPVISSAGPDKQWNTGDDLVIDRTSAR